MKRFTYSIIIIVLIGIFTTKANSFNEIRFHNETNDTIKINQLLQSVISSDCKTPNDRIIFIAKQFLNTPYVAHTLEGETEMLTINIDELDCTTFVETVMALSYTAGENRSSWRDFIYNLKRIRYRNSEINGYSSRLHYISDWIINNSHKGLLSEVTDRIPEHSYTTKTIDFMSSHRNSYKQLTDSIEFDRIKNIEMGYRLHRFPYIKKERLIKKNVQKALMEGDIIALTTKIDGLDVSHMGIITFVDGTPHLLHASMTAKKVIIDPRPLHEYLRRGKNLTGIRVIRLSE